MGRDDIELDPRIPSGKRYRLLSCHDDYLKPAHKVSEQLRVVGQPFELMYDSGAFTAWSQGKEVVLDDLIAVYDEMLEKHEASADAVWLISLDKIPGSRGRTATPAEIDEACAVSDRNFEVLKARYGDRVLPVFHQNESSARLQEIAAMADYICVSPRNDVYEGSRRAWAIEVHDKIPGKRTHGLAGTGYSMMCQVPWTSVDSATWVLLAANGAVFRDTRLRALQVSNESGSLKNENQHYRTLAPAYRKVFENAIVTRGFTIEQLETSFYDRMLLNRVMMTETYRALPEPHIIAASIPVEHSLFNL